METQKLLVTSLGDISFISQEEEALKVFSYLGKTNFRKSEIKMDLEIDVTCKFN